VHSRVVCYAGTLYQPSKILECEVLALEADARRTACNLYNVVETSGCVPNSNYTMQIFKFIFERPNVVVA
jgi:hypothetical protein